ncbi:hypothetical protein PMI16_01873 [Herbaspirillum sp. CF444]|nr:hypothetical protein PMI16_01873 [Herbaspirillum sp. CF444]
MPDTLTVSLRKRGWRSPVQELGSLSVKPDDASPNWGAVVSALGQWLAQSKWAATDAELIISDAFTRYVFLPWSDGFQKKSEAITLARIHFDVLFGEGHSEAKLSWHFDTHGKDGIACSIPEGLFEALSSVLAGHKIRLISVVPRFVHTFNTWRKRIAGNGLIVSVERDLCVMGIVRDNAWRTIRTVKLSGDMTLALLAAIDREIVLQGESEQTRVYLDLHAVIDPSVFSQMEKFHLLGRGLQGQHGRKMEIAGATA